MILNEKELLSRIEVNPKVLAGKPIIRGYRISVEQILKSLAAGINNSDLLENFPELETEDILACMLYAAKLVEEEKVYLDAVSVKKKKDNKKTDPEDSEANYLSFEEWNKQFDDKNRNLDEYLPDYGMALRKFRIKMYNAETSGKGISKGDFFDELDKWKKQRASGN